MKGRCDEVVGTWTGDGGTAGFEDGCNCDNDVGARATMVCSSSSGMNRLGAPPSGSTEPFSIELKSESVILNNELCAAEYGASSCGMRGNSFEVTVVS